MHEYTLSLTGLVIRLETPFELLIRSETAPFMSVSSGLYDICIRFCPVEQLPPCPTDGRWVEDMFYTSLNGFSAVYVRNYVGEAPYAVLIYRSAEIECIYLQQFQKYVSESSSILNLIGLEKLLLDADAFLLHASFIRWKGNGILFSAPCGTGKSTQADLWEQYRNSETLNGDRAGVRCVDGEWTAFGMPFAGTSGIYRKESAPIAAIVTLSQGPENVIHRMRPMEAIRRLLPECSCRRWDSGFMNQMLDLLLRLVQHIPIYHLECRPDQGAVDLLHDTLIKDGIV